MRISDWSSDVCSSDLLAVGGIAALLSDAFVQWRGRGTAMRLLLGALAALGWFAAGHLLLATLYRPAPAGKAATVTMLTSLPLRWATGGGMAAMIAQGAGEDQAFLRLEAAGPVAVFGSLVAHLRPSGAA